MWTCVARRIQLHWWGDRVVLVQGFEVFFPRFIGRESSPICHWGVTPRGEYRSCMRSFSPGTKWLICNVVFNWQVGLLLWFSLMLLSQRNLADWIGLFSLFTVELLQFQITTRNRMTEKAVRVLLESLPNKSFRKIIAYETICRIKSLFHLVPHPFW